MKQEQFIRITKEFTFEAAHALDFYQGKCRNIHGHSYELEVTILGIPSKENIHSKGMVMDFGDLKNIVKEHVIDKLDHRLILHKNSPKLAQKGLEQEELLLLDLQPTCENMVIYIVEQIQKFLPSSVSLYSVLLRETRTSYAEWCATDQHPGGIL